MIRNLVILLVLAIAASMSFSVDRHVVHGATFAPVVSVTISDDTPLSHPDITTTIEVAEGPLASVVRVLTPAGGSIASSQDLDGNSPGSGVGLVAGWVSGFTHLETASGACGDRFNFTAPLVTASVDQASIPSYVAELVEGPYRVRFVAEVGGTPLNIVVREIEVDGAQRLETTTVIGDPSGPPAPACAPFRSRVLLDGRVGFAPDSPPLTTAPPDDGNRTYEFALTSRPDDQGSVQEAVRTVTADVDPGLRPSIEAGALKWSPVSGAASYSTGGTVDYTTTCDLIRKLVIRQDTQAVNETVPSSTTSMTLPAAPGAQYEIAAASITVTAVDAEDVLLDREDAFVSRPFEECWYAPGTEPLLTVEPTSGRCDGTVTLHGERFPADVRVAIAIAGPGTDSSSGTFLEAEVKDDGTFAATGQLPGEACAAAVLESGRLAFFAYNAAEARTLTVFASAGYATSGTSVERVRPPETGNGGYR